MAPFDRPRRELQALWERLPEEVRVVARDAAVAVGAELRRVRRPRDVRKLLRDPEVVTRLAEPLTPALDRIAELAAKTAVPLDATRAALVVGGSSFLSAATSSALEISSLFEIEAPPVAVAAASAAGVVGVLAELGEFYVVASHVKHELQQRGAFDVPTFRSVLFECYVGRPGDGGLAAGLSHPVAMVLVRRALPRLLPVANLALAPVSSIRDLRRARTIAARVATERCSDATGPAPASRLDDVDPPGVSGPRDGHGRGRRD